jgi:hypothetical protein
VVPGKQTLPQGNQEEEMIVDYRKRRVAHARILMDWAVVEQVLGINQNSWVT